MTNNSDHQRIGQPELNSISRTFVLLMISSVIVVVGLVIYNVRSQDRIAATQSVHLARSVLDDLASRLSDQLVDYSYWSEAVDNLVGSTNTDWADNNVGIYMFERFDIDRSVVLTPENDIAYAMTNGQRVSSSELTDFGAKIESLVAAARRSSPFDPPQPVSGFVRSGDTVFVVATSTLTRFKDDLRPNETIGTGWVLVFAKALHADRLMELSSNYLLQGLRLVSTRNQADDAHLQLMSPMDEDIGVLTWRVTSPSRDVLPWLALLIVLVFVGFGIIALIFFKKSQAITGMLSDNLDELRRAYADRNQALEEAWEAGEAKTRFLANMSHELRTPLNAIIGIADTLRHKVFGSIGNERYEEYVEDIHASSTHLLSLINDVLDISAIEAGKLDLEMKRFDPCVMVGKCLPLVRQAAADKQIDFNVHLMEGLPGVFGHERSVSQVLVNLLNNAIKYTPESGSVSLNVRWHAGHHIFTVRDTGCGIPPEKLPTITTPFTRAHDDHDITVEGTGLGLSISKQLIDAHHGDMTFDSVVGQGTTVTVTLPSSHLDTHVREA